MPTLNKNESGMGLASFLVVAALVAGGISTMMFRTAQFNRERLIETSLYYKTLAKTQIRALLGDPEICKLALHEAVGGNPPYVELGSFEFRENMNFGIFRVTDITLDPPVAPGAPSKLSWELTHLAGLATSRKIQDSVDLDVTPSPSFTCTLAGGSGSPPGVNVWPTTRGEMCAKLTRYGLTPPFPQAALDDCSFSSILAGDFTTFPTRWALEAQGTQLIQNDAAAAVRAGVLSNLVVGPAPPTCPAGEALVNITKIPGTPPATLNMTCEAIAGGPGVCNAPTPCTNCCRVVAGGHQNYSNGEPNGGVLPGPCTITACGAAQMGTGPGCTAPSFYCGGGGGGCISLTAPAVPPGCFACNSACHVATVAEVGLTNFNLCASGGMPAWRCNAFGTSGTMPPPPPILPQISSCNWGGGCCYNSPPQPAPHSAASFYGCKTQSFPGYCGTFQCR